MNKHTPGPWGANFTRIDGNAIGFHITDNKHGSLLPICETAYDTHLVNSNEIESNARLISAAPELLEALQKICEDNDFCGDEWGIRRDAWIETAKLAIYKATGESK